MQPKPAFNDYLKALPTLLFKPVQSGGRLFNIVHLSAVFIAQLPIVIALWFIYDISPYAVYSGEWLMKALFILIGLLLLAAYWVFLVYRFARFEVVWTDESTHRDTPASIAETKAGRIKSAAAFLLPILLAAAAMVAYTLLGYGLAPQRLYSQHKTELNRLAELTQGALSVNISPNIADNNLDYIADSVLFVKDDVGLYNLDEQDASEILTIINALKNDYIYHIYNGGILSEDDGSLHIYLESHFFENRQLVWLPEGNEAPIGDDIDTGVKKAIRLDDHWWLVYE